MPTKREHFQYPLRAQLLGDRMRQLREERGLTLKYIAASLGVEFSTLARYERAEWPFRRDHVIALLDVYGVYNEKARAELIDLASNAWRINQWEPGYGHNLSTSGDDWVIIDHWWVQSRAEEVRVYTTGVIPPLLQTRDYAETLVGYAESNAGRVDHQVRRLEERQLVLDQKPPTRLVVVMEESMLSRPVGGWAVLEAQLEHLLRAAERPHVKIHILPTGIGWHEGLHGSFTVCQMRRPYPAVALVEHMDGRLVVEDTAAYRYVQAFDDLKAAALSVPDSAELITEAAARARDAGIAGRRARSTTGRIATEAEAA